MKIELTESEYAFLLNLLKKKLKAIKNDISDIDSDINRSSTDLRYQKQEFIAYRNRLTAITQSIIHQQNNDTK